MRLSPGITKKIGNAVQVTAVEFAKSKNGARFTAHSKNEVVVASVFFLLPISNITANMLPQVLEQFIHLGLDMIITFDH